jgi:hypothetical protein
MLLVELYEEEEKRRYDVLYRYSDDDGSMFCILPFSPSDSIREYQPVSDYYLIAPQTI